jgi:hypothetical protein
MRVIRWVFEWSSQLSRPTAYARGICEGIAVHAGELSLCIGRIFMASVGGAYALAVLAIGALRESVSRPGKIVTGQVIELRAAKGGPRRA